LGSRDKKNIEYTDFPLLPLVEKTVRWLKEEYTDIDVQYTGDMSMRMYSSEIYMHIILKNLIENAIKYSWTNKTIDISFDTQEKRIRITDYGKGMNQEELKHMCLPFWQWDCSRGKDSWLWLWLTLVYELAELLCIQIHVVSEEGVWTTFTLTQTTR
jgi:signal transduction histidine kinase